MDIVLGVSMTPTTVRMVLVEGDKADGSTVDHDVFDLTAADDSANPTASEQVISAILGTQQSALAGGHRLVATGVTWTDHDEAATLREGLAARGIDDVTLVSELHAAGALAQAAGRAVGHDKTALMLIDRDTATLSVVETHDGSIVKVLSRTLHSADAMAVMAEMATSLEAHDARPGGLFVVGSGVDVTSVKEHLEHLVSVPVSAPDDAEMALARGAAIAAAAAPRFEASTVGLAYSQDPEAAATAYGVDPLAATQARVMSAVAPAAVAAPDAHDESRRPFLLVGSTLTSVFVIGVVALVISLAVSIRPTVDQRPNPGENVVVPSTAAPAPPQAQPVAPPPAQPPPAPETIPAPVPVVQQQPQQVAPRTVVAVPQAPPAPAAPPPAPAAPPPPPAAPAPPPVAPPPVYIPPPVYVPPPVYRPPVYIPPIIPIPRPRPPWYPHRPPVDDDDPPVVHPPVDDDPPVVVPRQPVVPQQPLVPQRPITPRQPPVIQVPQQPSGPSRGGPHIPFWPF